MIPSRFTRLLLAACVSLPLLLTGRLHAATPVPANLGNGLDKLVASQQAIAAARLNGPLPASVVGFKGTKYIDERTANLARMGFVDDQNRVLVRVTLNGMATFKNTRKGMKAAAASLSITATDRSYRGVGIMNAWVDVADVPALARVPGVSAVILEWKPVHHKVNMDQALAAAGSHVTPGTVYNKLGTDFDQGVTQHRVDQIDRFYNPSATADYEGAGMQIACISNSFNAHAAKPASTDVNRFDLPGSPSNPVNTTPVYVFEDDLSSNQSDDEGRGMCQIVYKMAPKAAVAFATADDGEVGFANNIRGLAGISGFTNDGQTFAADTICDDVGYFDEPYFQDGVIADGVDDASAAGACYFSSASNDIGTNGYDSDLHFVANGSGLTADTNAALKGTNINLASVPTNLYAGGFHNFNPNGQDVAQLVNDPASNTSTPTILQWNEPYDQTTTVSNPVNIYSSSGTYTDAPVIFNLTPSLTAGTLYAFVEATDSSSAFDAIVTIYDPNGNVVVGPQDTGKDETVLFYAPVTGTGYTAKVDHFATTTGAFTVNLYSTGGFTGGTLVQTQIYLLVFDTDGNYLPYSSGTTNALTTNQPIQILLTTPTDPSATQVQFVIARGNAPTGPNVATHVRYSLPGNGAPGLGPAEYFHYTTVTTGGHAMASTCNGCAAMSVFRPSLPEYFSSPGPVTVYFDKNNQRLNPPEVRLQPRIAAADGGNVSSNMNDYFADDTARDPDLNGNFFGTSAAGPHAAAIAALVLEAHGGPRSITPAQMTSLLERSTFPHDLDPNFASGGAKVTGGSTGPGKVTVTVSSDNNSTSAGVGANDPNAFAVNYIGGSSVTSIVFNPGGIAATAGDVSGGNNGVTYTKPPGATVGVNIAPGGTATYFENSLPGVAFMPSTVPFTLGTGITGATAAFTNVSGASTEYYTMSVTIPTGSLGGGSVLRFGVGRGYAHSTNVGITTVTNSTSGSPYYCADIFGGGVILPEGTVTTAGMSFSGTTADGGTFSGVIKNNIGSGYSALDGYGFVNAQAAVGQTVQ